MKLFQQKIAMLFLSLLVLSTAVFADAGKPDVKVLLDYGRFRYDSTSVYLEVYYSVVATHLKYQQTEQGMKGKTGLTFSLLEAKSDSVLASDTIAIHFSKPDTLGEDVAQLSQGILKLVIPPGKYKIKLASVSDTIAYDVSVKSFESDKITLSDLELCSNIVTNYHNKSDPYFKNTMEVVPNPPLIYGGKLPRLYYYIELYNLDKGGVKPTDPLLVQAVIADTDGKVRLKKDYRRNHQYESLVERGAFNVSRLESGLYTLIFAVTDSAKNLSVYRRRNFFVKNPNVVLARAEEKGGSFMESEFYNMPEKKVDEMFRQANYLATNSERKVYAVLNSVESKRQFMYDFWKKRNKEKPGWEQEYYQRVDYANENFAASNVPGWKTDMGRVYIMYGPPDQRERHPVQSDENPYETWFYHELEGGVEFDFVDMSGMGLYKLVHSTMRGEVYYPKWREYVYQR